MWTEWDNILATNNIYFTIYYLTTHKEFDPIINLMQDKGEPNMQASMQA